MDVAIVIVLAVAACACVGVLRLWIALRPARDASAVTRLWHMSTLPHTPEGLGD